MIYIEQISSLKVLVNIIYNSPEKDCWGFLALNQIFEIS